MSANSAHADSGNTTMRRPAHPDATGARPARPDRACCCSAAPKMVIMMPSRDGRPRPVDLWLCGHHYRASQQALKAAGATAGAVSGSDR